MACIVCRIAKLKTLSHVSAVNAHNNRIIQPDHVDKSKTHLNRVLEGSGDILTDVKSVLNRAVKIRSNAVIAVEMIITANALWFAALPTRPELFIEHTMSVLRQKYGSRLVSANVHYDEGAIHIHAVIVPTEEVGGLVKLNCRDMFGTRAALHSLQDWAGNAFAAIGLERGRATIFDDNGIPESKPVHTTPAQYRHQMAQQSHDEVVEDSPAPAEPVGPPPSDPRQVVDERARLLSDQLRQNRRSYSAMGTKLNKLEAEFSSGAYVDAGAVTEAAFAKLGGEALLQARQRTALNNARLHQAAKNLEEIGAYAERASWLVRWTYAWDIRGAKKALDRAHTGYLEASKAEGVLMGTIRRMPEFGEETRFIQISRAAIVAEISACRESMSTLDLEKRDMEAAFEEVRNLGIDVEMARETPETYTPA